MSYCALAHDAAGVVTTHPDGRVPPTGAHMSVTSCDRAACIGAMKGLIRRQTGLDSTFVPWEPLPADTERTEG